MTQRQEIQITPTLRMRIERKDGAVMATCIENVGGFEVVGMPAEVGSIDHTSWDGRGRTLVTRGGV